MIRKLMLAFATVAAAAAIGQTTSPSAPAQQTPQQTPEQRVARRVEYLTALVLLLPSQVTQITTIFTDEYKAASALSPSLTTARQAVRDAIAALAPDATIDRLTAAHSVLDGQVEAIHGKAQVRFLTVLTADQREKLSKFDGRHNGSGGPGRRRESGPHGL